MIASPHASRSALSAHPELPLNAQQGTLQPLVTLDVAVRDLRLRNTDQVLALIDGDRAGAIEWAWDISSPESKRRSEPRVFWRCLPESRRETQPQQVGLSEAAIYNEVVPSHWGTVSAARLRERWMCSQELIAKLIERGCLIAVTATARGSDGSPEVTRESVIQFLKARRIGAANINHGSNGAH